MLHRIITPGKRPKEGEQTLLQSAHLAHVAPRHDPWCPLTYHQYPLRITPVRANNYRKKNNFMLTLHMLHRVMSFSYVNHTANQSSRTQLRFASNNLCVNLLEPLRYDGISFLYTCPTKTATARN
jgi:hypothetical protein